jgi:hypothetical protein
VRTWLVICAIALTGARALAQQTPAKDEPIRLTADLKEQTYCRADPDTFGIQLRLALHGTNQTGGTLIVIKDMSQAYYSIQVAKNADDMAAEKYEYDPIIDHSEIPPGAPDDADLSKRFIVLKPGESFDSVTTVGVMATRASYPHVRSTLTPGKYLARVTLSTWQYMNPPEQTALRWKQQGRLVSEPITIEPIWFDVPPDAPVYNCR